MNGFTYESTPDADGDSLRIEPYTSGDATDDDKYEMFVHTSPGGAYLTRCDVTNLRDRLNEHYPKPEPILSAFESHVLRELAGIHDELKKQRESRSLNVHTKAAARTEPIRSLVANVNEHLNRQRG